MCMYGGTRDQSILHLLCSTISLIYYKDNSKMHFPHKTAITFNCCDYWNTRRFTYRFDEQICWNICPVAQQGLALAHRLHIYFTGKKNNELTYCVVGALYWDMAYERILLLYSCTSMIDITAGLFLARHKTTRNRYASTCNQARMTVKYKVVCNLSMLIAQPG